MANKLGMRKALWLVLLAWAAGGCVQRNLTVRSDPPGALVYMNDQEIGRTPVTRNFLWYGTYDMELRLPGYESIKTTAPVIAPWWQWVPFDLFTEILPVTDHHELNYSMHPPDPAAEDPALLARRGAELSTELRSTQRPSTQPTTRRHREKR